MLGESWKRLHLPATRAGTKGNSTRWGADLSGLERFDMIQNIPVAEGAAAGAVRTVEEMKSENDEAIEKDGAIGMENTNNIACRRIYK